MNHEKWARYVDAQESSGLPQKKWCEANQVNHHNFRYWRQRLKKEDTDINQAVMSEPTEGDELFEFTRVLIQSEGKNRKTTVTTTAVMVSIQLELRGMVLNIPSTYDEAFLLRLIRTLNRL